MSHLPESSPYRGTLHSGSVTALWVQSATAASNIIRVDRFKCSKCKTVAFYTVENLNLQYVACKCDKHKVSSIQWYVVAALITMQPTTKTRHELALRFGIDLSNKKWQHVVANTLGLQYTMLISLNADNKLLTEDLLCYAQA